MPLTAQYNTNITLSDLAFTDDISDIIMKYSQDNCDKAILKKTKEVQRTIDSLFVGLTPMQRVEMQKALQNVLIHQTSRQDLHNYLVTNIYNNG